MKTHFEILFGDDDIVLINKPAGLLSVPISGSMVPSALSVLRSILQRRGRRSCRPLVVHRIDRYTAGILVFAKHQDARHNLIQQFLAHTPIRRYKAVIVGSIAPPAGTLKHTLMQTKEGFRQVVVPKGQKSRGPKSEAPAEAILHYKTETSYGQHSLVEITLVTGLKNQIRAQFAAVGHPVVGDKQYGSDQHRKGKELDHQALFASNLEFLHPMTGQKLTFSIDPPKDFKRLIASISRRGSSHSSRS